MALHFNDTHKMNSADEQAEQMRIARRFTLSMLMQSLRSRR